MGHDPENEIQRLALARLRFERAWGLEAIRRVPWAMAPLAPGALPAAPAMIQEAPPLSPSPRTIPASTTPLPETVPAPPPRQGGARFSSDLFQAGSGAAALSQEEKAGRWEALEARALACARCGLHQGRTKVVFGEGNRQARLVFVGEGPGEDEDRTGRPFVGRAGQLLNKIIAAMGMKREEVYICNVVKCRPPGNRTPSIEEAAACRAYLEEQLELIAPKAIVALGAPAAQTLLHTRSGINALRGHWMLFRGIRLMPTFHPAYLLRYYTESTRKAVWEDMKQVVAFLEKSP